ncbi:hypothetical protein AG1IA_05608 [Rhizoctonia solani AG-1 IA]|uniref:Uncharacterized protein n=1 Tax=Thanatephorus cucumeris (strain AG1-IA) TaxID=983506 RepID=L8WUA8_THACA|nr:hypothetical protein AG1IA_05608 [Rhizoctonia solani AG-1 IA]
MEAKVNVATQVVAVFHSGRSFPNFEGAGQSYLSLIGIEYISAVALKRPYTSTTIGITRFASPMYVTRRGDLRASPPAFMSGTSKAARNASVANSDRSVSTSEGNPGRLRSKSNTVSNTADCTGVRPSMSGL